MPWAFCYATVSALLKTEIWTLFDLSSFYLQLRILVHLLLAPLLLYAMFLDHKSISVLAKKDFKEMGRFVSP